MELRLIYIFSIIKAIKIENLNYQKQDQNQFAPRPRAKPQIKKATNQLCNKRKQLGIK